MTKCLQVFKCRSIQVGRRDSRSVNNRKGRPHCSELAKQLLLLLLLSSAAYAVCTAARRYQQAHCKRAQSNPLRFRTQLMYAVCCRTPPSTQEQHPQAVKSNGQGLGSRSISGGLISRWMALVSLSRPCAIQRAPSISVG